MFSFKNKSYELLFREFNAEKQKFADFWVVIILLAQAPLVLHKFGLHSQAIGKVSYRAPFIIVHSLAQVLPLYFFVLRQRQWYRHRAVIMIILRLVVMATSFYYISFWIDYSELDTSFHDFAAIALITGSNWMTLLFWGLGEPFPESSWFTLQTLHLAVLLIQSKHFMDKLERGMHHLQPATSMLNSIANGLGMQADWEECLSEREFLYLVQTLQQVVIGYGFVCLLTYQEQLRSRRLWRESTIQSRSSNAEGSSRQRHRYIRDRGFDLLPTWRLRVADAGPILLAAFTAGQNFDLLKYLL